MVQAKMVKAMKQISQNNIPLELYKMPVMIFGGGNAGNVIIDLLTSKGIQIDFVIDDNEGLQGTCIKNIKVISFKEFIEYSKKYEETAVILATVYGKAVLKKLRTLSNVQVYELYGWYDEFLKMGNKNSVLDNFSGVETVKKMKEHIKFLETKWADEQSVHVLNGLVHYLETKDWNNLAEICTEEEQYFIPEVRAAIKMPLNIIDAGAYRGELLQNLKNNQIYFKKWYCFEADTENFSHLLEQSRKNGLEEGRQICVNKGLWSESGRLYFESRGNESRIVAYETDDVIDVVSIDEYFGGESCSYIKMDIEGAELPALRGGIKLIQRERPILAVSIYHSPDDFWQIPQYLMEHLFDYRYYVRHHTFVFCDTVLYAIPGEL